MKMRDPYKILGVQKTATTDEIKSAYRTLAKKHHPDQGGDEEKFKEISAAYEQIKDGKVEQSSTDNYQWTDIFDESTFTEDWINIFANAAGFHPSKRTPRNTNIRTKINISLESILEDNIIPIQINTGKETKNIEIRIPAGIHDGAVITYRGMGNHFYPTQPPGDLLIDINIESHSRFQREDSDLYSEITIDCFHAIKGTQIDFYTLNEKHLRINVPKGCQNGTVLRIPKEGLPSMSKNEIGNLYIRVNVKIPSTLTQKQIDLVEQIIELSK